MLAAQGPTGEIRLHVQDPSGAPIEAVGKLESLASAARREFRTDVQGGYTFSGLPLGRYRLEVSRAGFASQSLWVDVTSGAPAARTVTLQIAAISSQVEVVDTTPLAGTNLLPSQVAAPVQTATAEQLQASGALALGDFLQKRLNGAYLNEMQGNPFQPDVNFRGYTASPLLGTPEGLSVYVDGVRQNQPFGDVVSWDLIPADAISELTLAPGSDPLFGLNTLGGAVSVTTKSGLSDPGFSGNILYGSSGRKSVEGQWGGGKATGLNWFLMGTGFHESGWRTDSPSDVRQGFARLGWRNAATDLALTLSYADSALIGNGFQDYRLLAASYSSVYSIPDSTANRAPALTFTARHSFSDNLTLSGNAWYRRIRTEATNANYNTDALGQDIYQPTRDEQAALAAAGYTGFPAGGATIANTPFPKWPCLAEALQLGDPDEACDGVVIYSHEQQSEYGLSAQIAWRTALKLGRNQWAAGASVDRGSVDYTQNTGFAYVNPDYTLTSVPAWQDGSTSAEGSPVDSRVNLHGLTPNWSLYFTDTLTLAKTVNVTIAGRYNRSTVENFDRIDPDPGPGSLDGNYTFSRFNPSVGITWSPISSLNVYARYSQGSRAPTAIELGCADPEAPCSLPNSLSSDPPLRQVVTDSWEAGLRGRPSIPFLGDANWSAAAFRAENRDDILFVAAPQTGTGYFQNFGKTLRQGFSASLDGIWRRVSWGLDYTFLSATYQSVETLDGSANNANNLALEGYPGLAGVITVTPGDRIPLIPKQQGKAYADLAVTPRLGLSITELAVSSSYARGNENNAYHADGAYYLGPGVSPGYAVTNLRAHYDLGKRLQLSLQVDNLLGSRYYTAAWLANTALNGQGAVQFLPFPAYADGPYAGAAPAQSATFFAPGAPRRAWVELRLK